MRTPALSWKNLEFFEIYGVRTEKDGLASTDIFRREKGSISSRFYADVLYGRLLIGNIFLRKVHRCPKEFVNNI